MGHHHVRVEISADRPEIGRIMLPTPPDTSKLFPKKMSKFVRTHSGGIVKFVFLVLGLQIAYFGKVLRLLFLLRFGVPRCCFFKSMKFQLSFAQKIIAKALLDQKLCQFEVWSTPLYLVIFEVIIYIYFSES